MEKLKKKLRGRVITSRPYNFSKNKGPEVKPLIFSRDYNTPIRKPYLRSNLTHVNNTAIVSNIEPINIVVVAFNNFQYTKDCIDNIKEVVRIPHKIILVDNGSTDRTESYFSDMKMENFIYVRADVNLGFAGGNNLGFSYCNEGGDVLLLNNDVIMGEDSIFRLYRILHSDNKYGAIGPITSRCGGYQERGFDTKFNRETLKKCIRGHHDNGRLDHPDILIGFFLLIKREVFDKVGYLDEMFGIGMFEDNDYSRRILDEGYDLVIDNSTYVYHHGSQTIKKVVNAREQFTKGLELFREKWDKKREPDIFSTFMGKSNIVSEDLVSIVIINHNMGRYLKKCIESCLSQTYSNIEIVVVDDYSSDNSINIIEKYKDHVVTIFNKKSLERSVSRNIGFQKTTGKFVMFLDSDDMIHSKYVEYVLSTIQASPYNVKYSYTATKEFGNSNRIWFNVYNPNTIYFNRNLIPISSLIRREAFVAVNGFTEDNSLIPMEDWELRLKFIEHGFDGIGVPHPLWYYRRHNESSLRKLRQTDAVNILCKMRELHPNFQIKSISIDGWREILK